MAEKYFSKQDLTDFSIQSEDGGGLMFSKDAKYIFGAKQENITKQLNEEGYQGNVDINPNTNSSFIAIMNENSVPVDVNIPNINQYSLFEPQKQNIIQPDPQQNDCDPEFDAVLIGGLDTGAYKPLSEQLNIFKKGFGTNKKVKAFRHSDSIKTITDFLKDHPKVPVVMFSAGCKYADKIAAVPGINKNRIYIVEPYNGKDASKTPKVVQDAVASGVPAKNVYVGPSEGTGKGIIANPSLTDYKGTRKDHWDALRIIGEVINEFVKCGDQQVSTPSFPTPSPSVPTPSPSIPAPLSPLTAQEIEEGIYEANFLPAVENIGTQISEEILVKNLNDVIQNPPEISSPSVKNSLKAADDNSKKIPKDGEGFKRYGSSFKIIQTNDVKSNLGNQIYHPTALFNQGDPLWGTLSDGNYTMKGSGCAYTSFCMLVTHKLNDPGYTPKWMWDYASKSINTDWIKMAKVAKVTAARRYNGTLKDIDELLKTRPVEFRWLKSKAIANGYKGESYAYNEQHWMVIVGKNTDGTYTIFDPSGGKIRNNVPAFNISSGFSGDYVYIQ